MPKYEYDCIVIGGGSGGLTAAKLAHGLGKKVALVTGGSRGIGEAIALRLAQDGADVAINYHYTKEQAENVSRQINQMS